MVATPLPVEHLHDRVNVLAEKSFPKPLPIPKEGKGTATSSMAPSHDAGDSAEKARNALTPPRIAKENSLVGPKHKSIAQRRQASLAAQAAARLLSPPRRLSKTRRNVATRGAGIGEYIESCAVSLPNPRCFPIWERKAW